ncbi:MAG: hypothetical protein QXO32_03490 [Candidatus Bathyarchaeia archaeon]
MVAEPWIGPKWISSRWNFDEAVLKEMSLPSKVQIYDVTCRDGEQRPGVVFRREDKVKIARKLDEVGIHRIEAGMPAVSEDDFEAVREIAHLGLSAKVLAFSRARRDDVDLALKCDVDGVLIEVPSSDALIELGFDWTKNRVLEAAVDSTGYAKKHGLYVAFFPYDTTRADPVYERKLMTSVVEESHVDSMAVVDTFGCASPQGMARLVRTVKSWINVPLEVHCHNDLGLATANSLAAVTAGAEVVHTNVNGIGERAGGAATEEVVVGLRVLYGVDLGIRYENLVELSKLVEELSQVKVPSHKPVVGDTAFGYEAGIPVMFCRRLKKIDRLEVALSYLPEFVGNKLYIAFGKKSGRHGVEWRLEEMGLKASDEQVGEILAEVKSLGIEKRRALTDKEVDQIIKKHVKS